VQGQSGRCTHGYETCPRLPPMLQSAAPCGKQALRRETGARNPRNLSPRRKQAQTEWGNQIVRG